MILGTDYPFPLGEVHGYGGSRPGKVIDDCHSFDDKVKRKLFFENGMEFLGLDARDY